MNKIFAPVSIPKSAFLLMLMLTPLLLPAEAIGATYDESIWYIYSESDPQKRHFADIRVAYSAPGRVEMGGSFDVDASVTYIDNENARCEWLEFYDVRMHLRRSPMGENSASALDTSLRSRVKVRPGQQYAHTFSLTAPAEPGEYYVAMTWNTTNPRTRLAGLWEPGDPLAPPPAELNAQDLSWDTGKGSNPMGIPKIEVETVESKLTFQITLATEPKDADLTVNGTVYVGDSLPRTFEWDPGSVHILQVSETAEIDPGVRLVFIGWSDGSKETSRVIVASESAGYTARYKTQYELKVVSDIGDPEGPGWYDADAEATISVDSPQAESGLMGSLGAKKVFEEWTGDLSSDSRTETIIMDGPKTVEAKWTTDNSQAYVVLGGMAAAIVVVIAMFLLINRRRAQTGPKPVAPQMLTRPPAARPPSPTVTPRPPAAVKHCIHCGATIPSVVVFCTKCGKKQR